MVPVIKANGKIHLAGDYSVTINKSIILENYPIPNVEEILYDFSGGKFFSKFDIKEAYMHVMVSDESSKLLTINTPKGLFHVTRLNYGLQSAPAIWRKLVEQVFRDVPGCRCFYDDIKISSSTAAEHYDRVKLFFSICWENGIKLNKAKCEYTADQLTFLGF